MGVHNIQVFRSCRAKPETADQDGWTYARHMDLAVWKGRLYAAWAMTPKDEDVPPYEVVYATSADGFHWSAPVDLFPRNLAWASRFYFYRASNDRMLAFCAGKSAAGNNLLLEQRDYGKFLGERRMKWHDDSSLNSIGFVDVRQGPLLLQPAGRHLGRTE